MKKRKLKIKDKRPKWNDPNLTVMHNRKEYSAEQWQKMCKAAMNAPVPNWKDDPSYNWGKKCTTLKKK